MDEPAVVTVFEGEGERPIGKDGAPLVFSPSSSAAADDTLVSFSSTRLWLNSLKSRLTSDTTDAVVFLMLSDAEETKPQKLLEADESWALRSTSPPDELDDDDDSSCDTSSVGAEPPSKNTPNGSITSTSAVRARRRRGDDDGHSTRLASLTDARVRVRVCTRTDAVDDCCYRCWCVEGWLLLVSRLTRRSSSRCDQMRRLQ